MINQVNLMTPSFFKFTQLKHMFYEIQFKLYRYKQ